MSTSVTSKGQVTIPKSIRGRLGIRTGSHIEFKVVGSHAELYVRDRPVDVPTGGFGLLKSKQMSVPAEFDPATLRTKE